MRNHLVCELLLIFAFQIYSSHMYINIISKIYLLYIHMSSIMIIVFFFQIHDLKPISLWLQYFIILLVSDQQCLVHTPLFWILFTEMLKWNIGCFTFKNSSNKMWSCVLWIFLIFKITIIFMKNVMLNV